MRTLYTPDTLCSRIIMRRCDAGPARMTVYVASNAEGPTASYFARFYSRDCELDDVIAQSRWHGPAVAKMSKLQAIVAAVKVAREAAEREARETCGREGMVTSRGAFLGVYSATHDCQAGEAESWRWDSTKKALLKACAMAEEIRGYVEIQGGFDWALNPREMADGNYDPYVSTWGVTINREMELC